MNGRVPPEELERLLDDKDDAATRARGALEQIIERLTDEGFLGAGAAAEPGTGRWRTTGQARFEVTDKGLDFLGYKALRAPLGRSSRAVRPPRHRQHATGIETTDAPKPYEFGDTLNLDVAATLLNAVNRRGSGVPLDLDYADLMVRQAELRCRARRC